MKMGTLLETLKKCEKKYFQNNTVLVLSVSMGVDSAVLLEACHRQNYLMHVVHFNHHRREQSVVEEAFLKEYCQKRDIRYSIIDVPQFNGNFQSEARGFRYTQLEMIAKQYDSSLVVTAHHVDDQVETYLQRLMTGSSIIKRTGMKIYEQRENVHYLRPFLTIEKQYLYEVASENNIHYFEDESNFENDYTRNQIRNQIVPSIQHVFPTYRKAVQNDIAEACELAAYFDAQWQMFAQDNVIVLTHGIRIERKIFLSMHEYMQGVILERVVRQHHFSLKRSRYGEMKQLILKGQGRLLLKKSYYLEVFETHFFISLKEDKVEQIQPYCFFLNEGCEKLPKPYELCYNYGYSNCDDMLEIHSEDLPFLQVRNYKQEDRVQIGNHHKRVQRLFIDKKVPAYKRPVYPIIEDTRTNQIVWIPNVYKSYKRDEAKEMLKIYFKDGGFYA